MDFINYKTTSSINNSSNNEIKILGLSIEYVIGISIGLGIFAYTYNYVKE